MKLIFPESNLFCPSVTDKWSPCLYLIPWSLLFWGFYFCFSLFIFSLFLLGDEERVEWAAGWEFDCWPKLTHQRQHPWSTSKIQLQNTLLPKFLLLWLECLPVAYTQCPPVLKQSPILTFLYWLPAALTFCLALEQGSGSGTSPHPPVQWVCSASQSCIPFFSHGLFKWVFGSRANKAGKLFGKKSILFSRD